MSISTEHINLFKRLICTYQPLKEVDIFISTSKENRPLKRISPLVWIDARRPLDEKEISAVTLPVTIDHPASENMLETLVKFALSEFIQKISTVLFVGREIR
jgi:hypothetical protein